MSNITEKKCVKYIVICSNGEIKYAYDTDDRKAEDVVLSIVGSAFTTDRSFVVVAKTQKSGEKILRFLMSAYEKLPKWLSKNVLSTNFGDMSCMKFKENALSEEEQNEITIVSF